MAENRNPVDLREQSVSPRPIRMVCLDLDGTLFNGKKEVGSLSRQQIRRCLLSALSVLTGPFMVRLRGNRFPGRRSTRC